MLVGIGDDAAVVEPERNRLEVLSVDALVEGVHFDRAFTPPDAIGHRALAVNLSDLAAMGAAPRSRCSRWRCRRAAARRLRRDRSTASPRLPRGTRRTWPAATSRGRPDRLMIDVTVVGTVKRRQVLTRGGARPGDELYVTGTIGAAAAGPRDARRLAPPTRPADRPDPRDRFDVLTCIAATCVRSRASAWATAGAATARRARASISATGSPTACTRSPRPSGVGVDHRRRRRCPIDPARATGSRRTAATRSVPALTGGDDYELLFAVRPRLRGRFDGPSRGTATCRSRASASARQTGARLVHAAADGAHVDAAPARLRPLSMIHLTRALVRRWLDALLHIEDTPERTAAAFALGVFFGFSPFLGLHTILGDRRSRFC